MSQEILQKLLKRDWNKVLGIQQFSNCLSQAARNHNGQVVMYWLEEYPEHHNLVVDPATVIDVSKNGFIDILPPLIEQIRPTDSFEKTLSQCLQVASRNSHTEVVEYLIREGADVNTVVEEAVFTSRGNLITRKPSPLQAALIGFDRFRSRSEYYNLKPGWTGAVASFQQRSVEILLTVEIVRPLISSGAHAEAATREHGTALEAAACRELGGLPIKKALLEASARDCSLVPSDIVALNKALSFFESFHWNRDKDDGKYILSTSIIDVLETGPGAIVKILLANLSEEKQMIPVTASYFRWLAWLAIESASNCYFGVVWT